MKNRRYECERGNYEDVLTFCDTAESICSKYPQMSAPLLANIDHHYTWVSSFVSRPDLKHFHAERMVDYHQIHNDRTNNGWLYLGIAFKELSMYYVEVEDFERAITSANSSLLVYGNCTFYQDKTQMPILPRIAAGWAYLGLSKLKEAEDMILPCVEWVKSNEFQWDFNAHRYICSNII
jgi:hypothetical protein